MSTPESALPPAARYGWIRPWWFIGGLVLGLVSLSFLGARMGRTDIHPGFVRFHSMISPEGNYYPTLNEMTAIVRARCRPDQVLVIVGGNSVLQGVWQRDVDIWSARLQDLLGDGYCVVNFAFRGAAPADGGAVVAEVLRKEFPRQVLIANDGVLTGIEPVTRTPYRYIFWQAYFAGKLITYPERETRVREYRAAGEPWSGDYTETRATSWIDFVLHYRDLWNWVTVRYVGSVPSYVDTYFPAYLKPHGAYADQEPDGTDPIYDDAHYPASTLELETRIATGPRAYYSKDGGGKWRLAPVSRGDLTWRYAESFPQELKARTLMLVSGSSPYYVRRLSADDQAMVDQASSDTVELFREAGYASIDYGRDFEPADFGDRTHLTKLGGSKLAALVAPQVREISRKLGYIK
jgi:hypothetical protein